MFSQKKFILQVGIGRIFIVFEEPEPKLSFVELMYVCAGKILGGAAFCENFVAFLSFFFNDRHPFTHYLSIIVVFCTTFTSIYGIFCIPLTMPTVNALEQSKFYFPHFIGRGQVESLVFNKKYFKFPCVILKFFLFHFLKLYLISNIKLNR